MNLTFSKRTTIRRRRTVTAFTAVALASAIFSNPVLALERPFVEYGGWADMADAVAVSRAAAGDPVLDYKWTDVIRLDVDTDGEITQHDADIMIEYIQMYDLFDAVCEMDISETKEQFRMEMSEEFGVSMQHISVFYGFRAQDIVPYEPDRVMIGRIYTLADGGFTGYAIQEDPYTGDVLYKNEYNTGDIVVFFNVYTDGDPYTIRDQSEFRVGNVSELGFDYTPRPEIVQRALANDDFRGHK